MDAHPDPVAELRRVYEVAKVELLPFVDALPTRDNPKVDLEVAGSGAPSSPRRPRAVGGPRWTRLHAVDPEAEPLLEEGGERLRAWE